MRVFFIIVLIIFGFMAIYLIATNPYTNPYKLIMIFGKKGSGKSTILTKSFNSFLAPKLPDIEFQCVTYDRDKLPDISDEDKSDQDNPDDDKPDDSDAAIEELPEDEDKIEENEPDKNTALQEEGRV